MEHARPEPTTDYLLRLAAGESPDYPDGVSDNTHFQAHGAIEAARLVAANACTLPGRDHRALHNPDIPDDVFVWARPAQPNAEAAATLILSASAAGAWARICG